VSPLRGANAAKRWKREAGDLPWRERGSEEKAMAV
jgi:hypothetical protein